MPTLYWHIWNMSCCLFWYLICYLFFSFLSLAFSLSHTHAHAHSLTHSQPQTWKFRHRYPDSWYHDITSNKKFFSLAATFRGSIVGMIVAEIKGRTKVHKEVCSWQYSIFYSSNTMTHFIQIHQAALCQFALVDLEMILFWTRGKCCASCLCCSISSLKWFL